MNAPEIVPVPALAITPSKPSAVEWLSGRSRPNPDVKPIVLVPSTHTTITASSEKLFGVIGPKKVLFNRGGTLAQLIHQDGRPIIQTVDPATAASLFEQHVEFKKQKRSHDILFVETTNINESTAKLYLKSAACRELLPTLRGVVSCPLLVERDGRIHQVDSGYDPTTGFYVANHVTVPELPLEKAVENLNYILEEYWFKTDSDKARSFASMLTPALKFGGFITESIPIEVAEANMSQAGKSYRQQVVAAIYRERMGVVTNKTDGVGGPESTFQKHLSDGRAFIQFDNLRGKLDSQLLESFITAKGSFPVRIAFHPDILVDPSKHAIYISSNGFESTKDLANRSSIVRIIKRENHNFRSYDGLDLVEHVFSNISYLASVYAVVKHWHAAGKPRTLETRHDFKQWCQICDWIVINVFKLPGLMEGHQEAKERASNPNLSFFRNLAVKLEAAHRLDQAMTASNIAEFCQDEEVVIIGLAEARQDEATARRIQVGKLMKAVLGDADERSWEGFRVVRTTVPNTPGAVNPEPLTAYLISRVE